MIETRNEHKRFFGQCEQFRHARVLRRGFQGTFADVIGEAVAAVITGETIRKIRDAHKRISKSELSAQLRMEAISAIDVSQWDLRGKELGAPVYELLADDYDTTPTMEMLLYASCGMYMVAEENAEQVWVLVVVGFSSYKNRPRIVQTVTNGR